MAAAPVTSTSVSWAWPTAGPTWPSLPGAPPGTMAPAGKPRCWMPTASPRTRSAPSTTACSGTSARDRRRRSDEGGQAGDGAADDQGVDLARALVGVDRLGVGDEPADLLLQQDAVPAEQLAGVADALPHPHRAEGLGQRRMLVGGHAVGLQLGQPGAQAGRGGDVREHPHQQVLDELEASDRLAE